MPPPGALAGATLEQVGEHEQSRVWVGEIVLYNVIAALTATLSSRLRSSASMRARCMEAVLDVCSSLVQASIFSTR